MPLFLCYRSCKENEEAGDTIHNFLSNISITFKTVDMVRSQVLAPKIEKEEKKRHLDMRQKAGVSPVVASLPKAPRGHLWRVVGPHIAIFIFQFASTLFLIPDPQFPL